MRIENKKDISSGIIFIFLGVFIWAGSFYIPRTTSDVLGSRFFPRVVSVLIFLLAGIQIVKAYWKEKYSALENTTKNKLTKFNKPLILTVIALFAYYVLTLYFGFTITSILYLFAQSLILMQLQDLKNKKKILVLILVSIIVPVAINLIFLKIFCIMLPVGKFIQ
ncbi:MAG: tripartite tricarboxylate transporter TctB family protein [Fusobacteriaceae bacterium]|jgi:hypothetical protein|nr:tripartite tricarboxylate transporter TctB family protein [Fusobacteriaceae bacterium]